MSATATQVRRSERPIIFSGPMVRAILEGHKTQTRRAVKFPKHSTDPDTTWIKSVHQDGGGNWVAWSTDHPKTAEFTKKAYPNGEGFPCHYGRVGDLLWVRETWAPHDEGALSYQERQYVYYRADDETEYDTDGAWRPSIFMPRWASRITLEITNVRVERLQDISEVDAIAEGIETPNTDTSLVKDYLLKGSLAVDRFARGWESINGKRKGCAWADNPFVWVIEFRKL